MKLVTVEDLREGDIIASDVLLEDYTVVLSKGTVIKTQYIDKLRELEVFTVYIEERQEKEEKPQQKPPVAAKKPEEKAPRPRQPPHQNLQLHRRLRSKRQRNFLWKKLLFCEMMWRNK